MFSIEKKASFIQTFLKYLAKLPFAVAQGLGLCLGFFLYLIPNPLKKVARVNIQLCFPELSWQEQQKLICLSLMHTGASAAEYGAWWLWPVDKLAPLIKKVHGEEHIKTARAQGKGILILAPHLGAWESAQGYIPSRYPCSVMYRPLRIQALEEFVKKARERGSSDLLPLTPSGIRAAYSKLAKGELLVILPDQVPLKNGVFAPFFGIPAWTMTFAIKLAQNTQAKVLMAYGQRLKWGKGFELYFQEVNSSFYDKDLTVAATAMNRDIEACVRKIPEQYQWTYKRFKKQMGNTKNIYQ